MNLASQIIDMAVKIGMKIGENRCDAPKDVGDRVLIWDYSYSTVEDTGEDFNNRHPAAGCEMIIAETDCENVLQHRFHGSKNRDLLVYCPEHDIYIATRMDFVKLAPEKQEAL